MRYCACLPPSVTLDYLSRGITRPITGDGDRESDVTSASNDEENSEQPQDRDDELSAEDGTGKVAAAGGGGMGDVMARILGQKVDTRTQVGNGT